MQKTGAFFFNDTHACAALRLKFQGDVAVTTLCEHIHVGFHSWLYFKRDAVVSVYNERKGLCRVPGRWRDGRVVQTIELPCTSVWAVTCRRNGDLVVACDDGMARVFSCAPSRCAADDLLLAFHEHVAQISLAKSQQTEQGQIGDLNTKDLVGPDALTRPGKSDGQILLVKESSGKVMAHSVSAVTADYYRGLLGATVCFLRQCMCSVCLVQL